MKQINLLAVAIAMALASAAAFAQSTTTAPVAGKARLQLDANKDGVIDRAEAAKAPRIAQKFDQLDRNKDGQLGADERRQMRGMRHRGGKGGMHGRMMAADTDKDGRISRAEFQAAHAKAGALFEAKDFNKDGYLDRADMQARVAQQRSAFFTGADGNRDGLRLSGLDPADMRTQITMGATPDVIVGFSGSKGMPSQRGAAGSMSQPQAGSLPLRTKRLSATSLRCSSEMQRCCLSADTLGTGVTSR